jgi:hypothetical protein
VGRLNSSLPEPNLRSQRSSLGLIRLDSATSLEDLRALRGNRLEAVNDHYMKDEVISINGLAQALRIPANRISLIVNGKRGISADTAARLGRYFGT